MGIAPHKAPVAAFFYVFEGSPRIGIEGAAIVASAGTLVPSAAGGLHATPDEGDRVARSLIVKTPNPAA